MLRFQNECEISHMVIGRKMSPKLQQFTVCTMFDAFILTGLMLGHRLLIKALVDLMEPNVQLHHTKLFYKGKGGGIGFPMHQDAAWMRHEKDSLLTAIIYLTDATEEMGCLKIYLKSHKSGYLLVFN